MSAGVTPTADLRVGDVVQAVRYVCSYGQHVDEGEVGVVDQVGLTDGTKRPYALVSFLFGTYLDTDDVPVRKVDERRMAAAFANALTEAQAALDAINALGTQAFENVDLAWAEIDAARRAASSAIDKAASAARASSDLTRIRKERDKR